MVLPLKGSAQNVSMKHNVSMSHSFHDGIYTCHSSLLPSSFLPPAIPPCCLSSLLYHLTQPGASPNRRPLITEVRIVFEGFQAQDGELNGSMDLALAAAWPGCTDGDLEGHPTRVFSRLLKVHFVRGEGHLLNTTASSIVLRLVHSKP